MASKNQSETWTVMIYMAGDNNLSADMAYALNDIKQIANETNDNINIFVYYDSVIQDVPTYYFDFTDKNKVHAQIATQVKHPFTTRSKSEEILPNSNSTAYNENSAAMYSIMNFVNWCVNDTETIDKIHHKGKRTDKYALIFSGHGSSFQNISLMIDTSSNYYLTIPKLSKALGIITENDKKKYFKGRKLINKKLDILGFDSCNMGLLELGYQFKNFTNIMVASEGSVPNSGWAYGTILTSLISQTQKEKRKDSEKEIAKFFVEDFINKQNDFIIGGANIDISAWDLSKIDDVVNKLDILAKRLKEGLNTPFKKDLINSIIFSHWKCQSYMMEQHIDLKDFCEILIQEIIRFDEKDALKISNSCLELIKEIDKCILICGFSGGQYQYSNGVGLYFPWNTNTFAFAEGNYIKLHINRRNTESGKVKLTEWHSFLFDFLTSETLREHRHTSQALSINQLPGKPGLVIDTTSLFYPCKNNKLIGLNDEKLGRWSISYEVKDNPRIPGSKNNPRIPGSRDNPSIPGSKDNPDIPGSKGFETLLMYLKNTITPWNISGFTKNTIEHKYKD